MIQIISENPLDSIFGHMFGYTRMRSLFYLLILTSTAPCVLFIILSSVSLYPRSISRQTLLSQQFGPQCNGLNVTIPIEIEYEESAIMNKYVNTYSSITPEMWRCLKPAMKTQEKRTLRFLLSEFIKISETMNFTHFMISGTLLGSYRHHGLMPWDDDVDILMRYAQRNQILSYFRKYSKGHEIRVETGNANRMKLFHKFQSIRVRGWRYRWPTVDISFYDENSTHIWERYVLGIYNVIPKSLIFPLHRRPFELLWINSPFDAFAVLRLLYEDPNCVTLSWIHRSEQHAQQILKFNCEIVSGFYPFVDRQVKGGCIQEDLVLNGKVLYSSSVEEPIYAITKPYVLQLITEPDLNSSSTPRTTYRITNTTM